MGGGSTNSHFQIAGEEVQQLRAEVKELQQMLKAERKTRGELEEKLRKAQEAAHGLEVEVAMLRGQKEGLDRMVSDYRSLLMKNTGAEAPRASKGGVADQ